MSCFKIFFIFTKIFLIVGLTKAIAKEPNQVIVAKINNHVKVNLGDGDVQLGDILIDEDIQRQLDEKHCANKICNINLFDPALLQTLQCIKRNDGQFVSIDGQHTGSVIAGLIDEGFIKGDWKTFEFPVQFIETDDLAFARRAFQTLNGKGKKKQSAYQSLRNDVFIVRIDNQGDEEEIATENQVAIAERNECYPVEENSDLLKYPGTFTNIATFKTMTDDETEMACSWHNKYFHYTLAFS